MAELASQPTSVQSVYSLFRENKLFVNRRYQRKLVWTLAEKQKLIGSILKRYPIPAILLAETDGNSYEIIDGLQRLHAIVSFIETSFPIEDGRRFNIEYFPTAKSYADASEFEDKRNGSNLNQKEVSAILDYNLAISIMRGANEDEINDVFDRINTYGHRLSDQERRQAGLVNNFSDMVRRIACTLRGDESSDVLPLQLMPSISIDLPMNKHGYEVQADEVFWVSHGILRSTDLRDSMDEQCIADIAACIIGGSLIDRSKDALDNIYTKGTPEADRLETALEVYGDSKFASEFKFCIDEMLSACNYSSRSKLRDLIFKKKTTNAFPSVFAVIAIAFHELIICEKKIVADYDGLKLSLTNIADRIERGRKATAPEERRKNIDIVKGLIRANFIDGEPAPTIYENHSTIDIDAAIRRSEVELANYELKQGLLVLDKKRKFDESLMERIIHTICAMANNGKERTGTIIIGVTDKDADAVRVKALDGIEPKKVGKRYVVGVSREAGVLDISAEEYIGRIKDRIKQSALSSSLKSDVLSSIDFNSYYGLGVIVLTIPPQKDISYVGDNVYWRSSDSTELASTGRQIADVARRF